MANIDYYFSTLSPYTYLAGTRLEDMAKAHGAQVRYKPLDIMGLFARTGGTPPKDRHPNRQDYRLQDLRRSAAAENLPLNVKPAHWPTNPAPSCYAVIAAQKAGGDVGALVQGFCRAVWAEERDIADDDVVADVLSGAGFDKALADSAMMNSADEYAANLEEAIAAGAFGAPFYITDGNERFWGHDRLAHLDLHLAGKI